MFAELVVVGINRYQRGIVFRAEAAGVVFIKYRAARENGAELIGIQGDG